MHLTSLYRCGGDFGGVCTYRGLEPDMSPTNSCYTLGANLPFFFPPHTEVPYYICGDQVDYSSSKL